LEVCNLTILLFMCDH